MLLHLGIVPTSILVVSTASVTHPGGAICDLIPSFVQALALVTETTWVKGQVSPLGSNISSQSMKTRARVI